jgi:uncharacterized protein YutE (UPF0331/DUF86 family)
VSGLGANGTSEGDRAPLNRDLLLQRIQEIRSALDHLRTDGGRSQAEFLADANLIDAVKYRLVVAIEAAVSICTHVAARLARRTPESYADCFELLAGAGIISADLAVRLGQMARFRNRLVHLYWKVDNERLWRILQEDLGDLDAYVDAIGVVLEGGGHSSTEDS